jgi:hypothetical protein
MVFWTIVKVNGPEVPPPGAGVETVTIAVPAVAMSEVLIAASKLVLETKVVVRALPFHWTVEEEMKLVPVTVSVNAAPPATTELGFSEPVATEGLGLGAGGAGLLEPPLHPTNHPDETKHNITPAMRKVENADRNRKQMSSTTALENRISMFIAPPLAIVSRVSSQRLQRVAHLVQSLE